MRVQPAQLWLNMVHATINCKDFCLKALLSDMLDAFMWDLAKPIGVSASMVSVYVPDHLCEKLEPPFKVKTRTRFNLSPQCKKDLFSTSCSDPATHSVTGISPGQSYSSAFLPRAKPPPGLQMSPNSSVPLPLGHLGGTPRQFKALSLAPL